LFFLLVLFSCGSDEKSVLFKPDPDTVYFEVGENSLVHRDSYLLPLSDPADIEAARASIQNGESKIVIAEISRITNPATQLNFDFGHNRKWSWYVSDFLQFTDFSIEILDGWPEYVEENYDEFVNVTKGDNGKGRIGFWNYSIKREVSHDELAN
jgi:hypothetical protein